MVLDVGLDVSVYTTVNLLHVDSHLLFVFVFVLLLHFNLLGSHIFSVNKNNVNSKFWCSTVCIPVIQFIHYA